MARSDNRGSVRGGLGFLGRWLPIFGQELIDLGVLHAWHPSQHVGEVFLSFDASSPATLQNRIDHRTAPTRPGMADKEPAALAFMAVLSELRPGLFQE